MIARMRGNCAIRQAMKLSMPRRSQVLPHQSRRCENLDSMRPVNYSSAINTHAAGLLHDRAMDQREVDRRCGAAVRVIANGGGGRTRPPLEAGTLPAGSDA